MTPEELLDATLAKARKVPIGGTVDPEEVTRIAIERARLEARVRQARRGRFLAGAAAAVAVLAVAWGTWSALHAWFEGDPAAAAIARKAIQRPEGDAPDTSTAGAREPSRAEPRRQRLASGDILVGSPGAVFDVLSEARDRVVRLDEGDVLFDVVHEPRGSFVVRTDDFDVVVLGTVFSVRRERGAIGVRVFEGSVLVRSADGDERQRLSAGGLWVSRPLAGMDQWGASSEREWQRIVQEGRRAERRAPDRRASRGERRGSPTEAQGTPRGAEESPVDPAVVRARARLAEGELAAVLRMSDAHPGDGTWLLLRADALRGLGRDAAAAEAYEAAARVLGDDRRAQAGFAAAQLRASTSPQAALALLERFRVTRPSSPLEERARALRIRLLRSVGRDADADAAELAHEERFGGQERITGADTP